MSVGGAASAIVELRGIHKSYPVGRDRSLPVLRGIDLHLRAGEYLALMGPSGSGKSTLMNIIGCLDRHDAGSYRLAGDDVGALDDAGRARLRGTRIGFVFQFFNLIPQLDLRENVSLPLFYHGVGRRARRRQAEAALDRVGLADRAGHRPNQISGGEMQRAAIARSLINDPVLLIGDEPTGNLDSHTGAAILRLFDDLHDQGMSMLLVTHDPEVGERAQRILHMRDGVLTDGAAEGETEGGGT